MKFGYKIRFAVTINRFVDVGTDACSRTKELLCNGRILFGFLIILIKLNYIYSEIKGFI